LSPRESDLNFPEVVLFIFSGQHLCLLSTKRVVPSEWCLGLVQRRIKLRTSARDVGCEMVTDRTRLKNAEELWIAKYRAALRDAPVQQSLFVRVRVVLHSAQNILVSQIRRIVNNWIQSHPHSQEQQKQRSARSSQSPPVPETATSSRKMNQPESTGKRSSRKIKATIAGKAG